MPGCCHLGLVCRCPCVLKSLWWKEWLVYSSILCIAGGAAITCKNDFETINEENLNIVSKQLHQAMFPVSSSENVTGMDWSKRPGDSKPPTIDDESFDQNASGCEKFVVVHGAGWPILFSFSGLPYILLNLHCKSYGDFESCL